VAVETSGIDGLIAAELSMTYGTGAVCGVAILEGTKHTDISGGDIIPKKTWVFTLTEIAFPDTYPTICSRPNDRPF
jgi:hypothetical protein